jgi:peroxiredoxin
MRSAALFCLLILAGCARGPKLGVPAADFTLADSNGVPVTLSRLQGRTVVLTFWADY